MPGLSMRNHIADESPGSVSRQAVTLRARGDGRSDETPVAFSSDEAAARHWLDHYFQQDARRGFTALRAPDRPELVPDLEVAGEQDLVDTDTRIIRFDQVHTSGQRRFPVFGSQAVVEIDADRGYVSTSVDVGAVEDISFHPSRTPEDALHEIEQRTGADLDIADLSEPELVLFENVGERYPWHLTWLLRDVPAELPEAAPADERQGHRLGGGPRPFGPRVNYLIDAQDGGIVYSYSSAPTLIPPTELKGSDVDGNAQQFWGTATENGFEMSDPTRHIKTLDLEGAELSTDLPASPVTNHAGQFSAEQSAAVTAHVNATLVHDFYESLMHRMGIDGKGMELVSVVNVTEAASEQPPAWTNAVWGEGRMWYGQTANAQGNLISLARHLDVVAHELTHGVIEYTSELHYTSQSGALNESFADIFGVIIKNWYRNPDPENTAGWDWEFGTDLGGPGTPLRDLSDPSRTGDPAHMDEFENTISDYGGVHTNSNIHNKAAHNLLTARKNGQAHFSVQDVATLYYNTMMKLAPMATFSAALAELLSVARSLYRADTDRLEEATEAIRGAYAAVGIE